MTSASSAGGGVHYNILDFDKAIPTRPRSSSRRIGAHPKRPGRGLSASSSTTTDRLEVRPEDRQAADRQGTRRGPRPGKPPSISASTPYRAESDTVAAMIAEEHGGVAPTRTSPSSCAPRRPPIRSARASTCARSRTFSGNAGCTGVRGAVADRVPPQRRPSGRLGDLHYVASSTSTRCPSSI